MTVTPEGTRLHERFDGAQPFADFLATTGQYRELWNKLYDRAKVPDEIVERVRALSMPWHMLVLSEDWCGDSINTLPLLARLTEAVPGLDMRLLERDKNPELMNAHLTGTSRSIPVVMLLDREFMERAWWGPRPAPLQAWVLAEGMSLPKAERYRHVRTWYARDHGWTTLREIAALFERVNEKAPSRGLSSSGSSGTPVSGGSASPSV